MRPLPSTQRIQHSQDLDRLEQSRRLEAIGRLTGGVAHDFNNLLTVMLSALESLMEADLQPEDRRLAEVSLEAAERGADLIRRLLAFARPAPRNGEASSTDAGGAVETTARLLQRTLPEQVAFEVHAPDGLIYCRADRAELESVLLNLCVNGRDAMPDGGRLRLTAEARTLGRDQARPLGVKAGDYAVFTVEDTGIGMSPETLARAIEPFFSTKAASGGTGLGLSAAHSLAVGSGGALDIVSRPGRGARVALYLPRSRAAAQSELDLDPRVAAPLACAVLLVEDEATVRVETARLLRALGCRVSEAADAEDALTVLSGGEPIDLMITDLGLPFGLDGRTLAEVARAIRPDLRVLFMSGGLEAASGPSSDFLPKPFGRAVLGDAVQRQLQRRPQALSQSQSIQQ
jgi:nitrogen-specific signal transduction histidine kinase/ActR/RegA family two-component response regulator